MIKKQLLFDTLNFFVVVNNRLRRKMKSMMAEDMSNVFDKDLLNKHAVKQMYAKRLRDW